VTARAFPRPRCCAARMEAGEAAALAILPLFRQVLHRHHVRPSPTIPTCMSAIMFALPVLPTRSCAVRNTVVGRAEDGEAEAAGPPALRVGDRVMGVTRFGAFASRLNVAAHFVRRVPDGWTSEQARHPPATPAQPRALLHPRA
jgi:hypothetical protein